MIRSVYLIVSLRSAETVTTGQYQNAHGTPNCFICVHDISEESWIQLCKHQAVGNRFVGVTLAKRQCMDRWIAYIHAPKYIFLGEFDLEEQAAICLDEAHIHQVTFCSAVDSLASADGSSELAVNALNKFAIVFMDDCMSSRMRTIQWWPAGQVRKHM